MPKTNAEYCRDYRKKRRANKIKKTAKSSTERVREFRARQKELLNVKNNISNTPSHDTALQNSESDYNGLSSFDEAKVKISAQSSIEHTKYDYFVPILHEVKHEYSMTDHEIEICKDALHMPLMDLNLVKEKINTQLSSYKKMESNQIAGHVANVKIENPDVEVTELKVVKDEILTDEEDLMNEQRVGTEDITVDIDIEEMKLELLEDTDGIQLQDGLSSLDEAKVKILAQSSTEHTKYNYFVPILHEIKEEKSTTEHETEICKDALHMPLMDLNLVKEEKIDDELLSYKKMESNQIAGHVANVKIENTDVAVTGLKDGKDEILTGEEDVTNEQRAGAEDITVDIDIEEMKLELLEDTDGVQLQDISYDKGSKVTGAVIQEEANRTVMPGPEDKKFEEQRRHLKLDETEKGESVSSVYNKELSTVEIQEKYINKHDFPKIKDTVDLKSPPGLFQTIVNDNGITYECTVCKYRCNRKGNLKRHLRTHTGEKPFECTMCQRRFNEKSQLKRHVRTHTGEKPYECTVCKNKFNENGKLKIHLRIHTGNKPFECAICKYRCNLKSDLTTHLRTHTGEKPFECTICAYRCNRKSDLKKHLKTHARAKPR